MKLPVFPKKLISERLDSQVSDKYKEELEKQAYRIVGNHSAVKICGWTKNMIKNCGGCYKFVFYGIRSHQCMQMTTSMFCASRCKFCWRGAKAPVSKEWYGVVDEPGEIIDGALREHEKLLYGFDGNEKSNPVFVKEKDNVRHVALSLTGEPITYPKINEILEEFHKRKVSTFLVTNAQYPEQIRKIKNVTQLYLSIDAPTRELLREVDRPLFEDYWERMNECLDLLKTRKYRTCIRLTAIHGLNDVEFDKYKELIEKGNPDFIEVKGYMHVGHSQKELERKCMPLMEGVREFVNKLEPLIGYSVVREHEASRAVLLVRTDLGKKSFIDFPKFFEKVNNGEEIETEEYSVEKMMPNV